MVSGTKRDMYGALDLTKLSSHVHFLSKPLSWSCWSSFARLWLSADLCLIPEVEQPDPRGGSLKLLLRYKGLRREDPAVSSSVLRLAKPKSHR